jgi:phage-related minor tail protein
MKLGELKKVFDAAADVYRDAGSETVAEALKEVSRLCDGRESTAVATFAKLVADLGPVN